MRTKSATDTKELSPGACDHRHNKHNRWLHAQGWKCQKKGGGREYFTPTYHEKTLANLRSMADCELDKIFVCECTKKCGLSMRKKSFVHICTLRHERSDTDRRLFAPCCICVFVCEFEPPGSRPKVHPRPIHAQIHSPQIGFKLNHGIHHISLLENTRSPFGKHTTASLERTGLPKILGICREHLNRKFD